MSEPVEKIVAANLKFITRTLNIRIKGWHAVSLRPSQIERLIEAAREQGRQEERQAPLKTKDTDQ